jgi:hypothetical protein
MNKINYVCIVSPYPGEKVFMDGWMSRIKTIDLLLSNYKRIYIDFQEWFPADSEPEIVHDQPSVTAYRLNPWSDTHRLFCRQIFSDASFVYIHTLHQCEYMLDYFQPEKMFIDIHGVVPEEEAMMGSVDRSEKFQRIEKEILSKSRSVSVVTKAMRSHYQNKYPRLSSIEYIHIPVFDYSCISTSDDLVKERVSMRSRLAKPLTVYAGGTQRWQRVTTMMETIVDTKSHIYYEIYSHNVDDFKDIISRYPVSPSIFKGNVTKVKLEEIYKRSTFGFSIREDIVVNRVASPTKICDYCSNLVIPIIDFSEIGDFSSYGYAYVDLDDYRSGFIPDLETQEWMISQNLQCMREMYSEFISGATQVLRMIAERVR